MSSHRPAFAFTAICVFTAVAAIPGFCTDLTIVSGRPINNMAKPASTHVSKSKPNVAGTTQNKPDAERLSAAKKINKKDGVTKVEKAKRRQLSDRRDKLAYPSVSDPLYALTGTARHKDHFKTMHYRIERGIAIGYLDSLSQSPGTRSNGPAASSGSAYQANATDSAGVAFDCRGRTSSTDTTPRELTACYVHKHDKSWKSQTYLSRKFLDGGSGWGAGLAIGYAY
jgi:hypothetical protein